MKNPTKPDTLVRIDLLTMEEPRMIEELSEQYIRDVWNNLPRYVKPTTFQSTFLLNQALGAEYMVKQGKALKNEVYNVPEDIDREIARLKLESMGVNIDALTSEQQSYLASWEQGT